MTSHTWVDFKSVKARVSMEMALAHYGIHLQRLNDEYQRGRCPLPTHESRRSDHSFIVNMKKNAWACHSESCVAARGGRIGGNVLDFIALLETCSVRDAALKLQISSPRSRGSRDLHQLPRIIKSTAKQQ